MNRPDTAPGYDGGMVDLVTKLFFFTDGGNGGRVGLVWAKLGRPTADVCLLPTTLIRSRGCGTTFSRSHGRRTSGGRRSMAVIFDNLSLIRDAADESAAATLCRRSPNRVGIFACPLV